MNLQMPNTANKAVDSIQQRLTEYACSLNYDGLAPEVIHTAKARVIDTFGALIGGFFGEPCCIARNLAAQMPKIRLPDNWQQLLKQSVELQRGRKRESLSTD